MTAEVLDWTPKQYHADITANTRGMLVDFLESRSLYYARYITDEDSERIPPKEQTDAMLEGTLVDLAITQPLELEIQYCCGPKKMPDRRTTIGKEQWAVFLEEVARGREVIAWDMWERIKRMADAVFRNETARKLLEDRCQDRQHVVRWRHEKSGLMCKCMRDIRGPGLVVDLKRTAMISPYAFVRQVLNMKWHLQAAMYCDSEIALTGHDAAFAFLAVHSERPHEVSVYELGQVGDRDDAESALELGRREYERALMQIAECHETGDWRNPWEKGAKVVDLPFWAGKASGWQ